MPKVLALIDLAAFYFTGNPMYLASATALLTADAYIQQKAARRRAIEQYNASLKDRMEMVGITPDQPRTIALGRVRAVEGVRRRWVSGANDGKLTMVISLASHEIDAVETVYFDDVALTLDGSGYVQTAPYFKTGTETPDSIPTTVDGSGNAVATLVATPVGGVVHAVWSTGFGQDQNQGSMTLVSLVGLVATFSGGPPGASVAVSYSFTSGTSTARIRAYLGASGQNVGAALAAEYPGKISATDQFAGIAVLVVDVDYDPDVYPQGRPNVTAVFRGAKVYDPRADSTAGGSGTQRIATPSTWTWSSNPALHAYHVARHASLWSVPPAELMPAGDVATEANFCDTSTLFTLRAADGTTNTVTLPRYRCGITISTAGQPRAAMDDILQTMAGRSGWAGGVWRFRCGRMPTSVADMGASWLARRLQEDGTPEPGPTMQFTNGVPREQKVNRVTGVCVDPDQRYQVLPFPAIQDSVLIAAEGSTYPLEVEYQGVDHIAHAQHLASIAIRRNQASLRLQATCNLNAYRLELFDVVSLTLPAYSITAKTMEVVGWRWNPTEGVQLSQSEITDAIYSPIAELVGRDPAPNSALPSPWDIEALTGLTVTSGLGALSDGSIITRTRVAWTAAAAQAVRAGGRVEVQYRQVADTTWQIWEEAGGNTAALIPGLRADAYYLFRARFVSAAPLRVRGDWTAPVLALIAAIPLVDTGGLLPGSATELTYVTAQTGSATWTRPSSIDLLTALRYSLYEISWTNTTGSTVLCECNIDFIAKLSSGPGSVRIFGLVDSISFSSPSNYTNGDGISQHIDCSAGYVRYSKAVTYSVPSGTSVYATAIAMIQTGNGTATSCSAPDINLKITAIKR
jgi:hypothetical protein